MRRLHLNQGRYSGETIDIHEVLDEIASLARDAGWAFTEMSAEDAGATEPPPKLAAWHRPAFPERRRVYVSAGIHGDEPAGPLAVRELLREDSWPTDVAVWLCPCLNPTGFPLNRRENRLGIDLNRQYRQPEAGETRAHVAWLEQQPSFDVALCLHEDWEANGFYLYELNPDGLVSHAESVIQAVTDVCPIELASEIEGRSAAGGIIRPSADPTSRPQWPEAFYLSMNKTRLSYTFEAPSDFPLENRVKALARATWTVLGRI